MARPKGNQAATAARRLAILDAGLRIFGKSGYNGGTLKEVAELVGVTEAGVLHHFKTKGMLLLAVLDHRDQVTTSWFQDVDEDPLHFPADWLNLLDYNMRHPGIVELYATISAEATSPNHPAHHYFRDRYKMVRESNSSWFKGLKEAGHLSDPDLDTDSLAVAIAALSDGLQIQWLLDRNVDMVKQNEDFFRSCLTDQAWKRVCQLRDAKPAFQDADLVALTTH